MDEETRKAIDAMLAMPGITPEHVAALKAMPGYEKPKDDVNSLVKSFIEKFTKKHEEKPPVAAGEKLVVDTETGKTVTAEEYAEMTKKLSKLEKFVTDSQKQQVETQVRAKAAEVLKDEGYDANKILKLVDVNKYLKVEGNVIKGVKEFVDVVKDAGFEKKTSDNPNDMFKEITLETDYKKPAAKPEDNVDPDKQFYEDLVAGKI